MSQTIRIACIGDIVGQAGRKALAEVLPTIQKDNAIDVTIANVENAAAGKGLTRKVYQELVNCNIDIMTSGNHIYSKRELIDNIADFQRLIRPLNYPSGNPGKGYIIKTIGDHDIAVINLIGRVFMPDSDCPFQKINQVIDKIKEKTPIVLVDIHAEATSEKRAMGWHLDGKASVVFGTHTHIQTADEIVSDLGQAYITDLGMTGSMDSILGVEKAPVIKRFLDQMPARFETAKGYPWQVNGIIVEIETQSGKAVSIERINTRINE